MLARSQTRASSRLDVLRVYVFADAVFVRDALEELTLRALFLRVMCKSERKSRYRVIEFYSNCV